MKMLNFIAFFLRMNRSSYFMKFPNVVFLNFLCLFETLEFKHSIIKGTSRFDFRWYKIPIYK